MAWPPPSEPKATLPYLPPSHVEGEAWPDHPATEVKRVPFVSQGQFYKDFKTNIGGKYQRISRSPYKRDRN